MNNPNRSVSPTIAARLEAFAERRRRLIVRRGLYALIVVLLVAMTLAATIDRFALLEDAARYAISGVAWLVVLAVVWRTCLRRLLHPPDRSEIARMIEGVRPELREDLLSAVELGYGVPDGGWDSPVFRDLLQQDVADRMQGIDVEALLPFSLNRLWSRLAAGVMVVCLILLVAPGLHFYRPFLRALIPGVNIQRISRTQIAVIEPRPADTVVPRGDTVTVVAELSGTPADAAWLESIQDGKRVRVAMKQVAARRFSADLDIGDEEVRYRIRAGDAMTRKYRLTAVPPPRVARFTMTYHYPPYLGWEDRQESGTDGNLEAPEGTRVTLELEVDQPVRTAALLIDVGERPQPVALESVGTQTLRASLDLREAGTYRVDLVAKQTGFPNRFSPEYEIVVLPDRVPTVERIWPERERTVMPDEILDMEAVARDDFGLAELQQQVQVNRGPWTGGHQVQAGLATEQVVVHEWDLITLKLQPGDRLFTRYVAVDGKGLRGESEVLKLIVGSPTLTPGSQRSLEERKQLARDLKLLRERAESLREVAEAAEKSLRDGEPESTRRRQQELQLAAAAERTRQGAEQAMDAIREALGRADDRLDVDDFAMTGRALSRVTREHLEQGQRKLDDAVQPGEPAARREAMREAGQRLARAAGRTAEVARNFDALLAADESRHLQQVLEALHQQQAALPDEAQSSGEERARRKQEMVATQAGEVKSALEELREWGRSSRGEIDQVGKTLAPADELRSNEEGFDSEMAGRMNDMLRSAAERMRPVADRLGRDAEKAREQLRQMGGRAVADAQEARQALEASRRSPEASRADTQAALDTAADLLADRADWAERSADAPSPWARDLDRASSIMGHASPASADEQETAESIQRLRALQDALRDLEAGQTLAETREAVERLAHQERWDDPVQAGERARAWRRLDALKEETERNLRQSDMPLSTAERFAEALRGPDAREAGREMDARLADPQRTSQSQSASLNQVAGALGDALAEAQPAIQAARERLAELSPSLSEQLADLGEEAGALAADTAAAAPGPEMEEVHGLLERQEALTEQVDAARDSLRRDALAQDLDGRPGRERARDADDALAMLAGLPEAAEAHLRRAPDPGVAQAAEAQADLAGTLNELSQHYANLDQGQAALTRPGLRAREESLDASNGLDAQYAELERLAAMLDQDPAQAMQALEQELAIRPAMRDALASIVQNAIARAAQTMGHTAREETGLAETMEALGQETDHRATPLRQRAEALAERASILQQERLPLLAARARDADLDADTELRQARRAAGYLVEHFPSNLDPAHAADAAARAAASGERMEAAAATLESVTGRAQDTAVGTEARGAATEAQAIAAEANDIADALQQLANHEPSALTAMAGHQDDLTATAEGVASDIGRVARHEARLGTERGPVLEQIGQSTRATAEQEMSRAGEMMATGSPAAQAAPLAADAGAALQARTDELAQMIDAYDPATARGAAMNGSADQVGQWLARALDRLDGGQQAAALPSELARAAGAQAASMSRSRTPMPDTSNSRRGAPVNAPAMAAAGELATGARASNRAWAALPERITRQLRDAPREAVPEEYRAMVDAYFKRIAQEGRK